jgi:hypothetical protein
MYTVPFLSLHALAAVRGDGLHPELLALFERLAAASNAGTAVVDFSGYQTDEVLQSGPIPVLPEHATVPEGVSRFPAVRDLASYDRMPARTEVQAMAVRQQETDCSIERAPPS